MAPATLLLSGPPIKVSEATTRQLPPSARRVFALLRETGAMTHSELVGTTRMSPRTLRFALRRLRDLGLVSSVPSLRDCRTCYIFVNREPKAEAEAPVKPPLTLDGVNPGNGVTLRHHAPDDAERPWSQP